MAHVFQNVLSNALKYRKEGDTPEIQITAVRDRDNWIVSVRNNGIGFEPQYSERRFGRGCVRQCLSHWLRGRRLPFHRYCSALPALPSFYSGAISALPFLSKLDPAGHKLLFSVPVGGAGVQLDSNGSAYVGGELGEFSGRA
jgi:hypothetical protein